MGLALTTIEGEDVHRMSAAQYHAAQSVIEGRAKITAMFGGIGSGKTAIGAKIAFRLAAKEALGGRGMIVTPSFKTFAQVTLPEIFKHWPKGYYTYSCPQGHPTLKVTIDGQTSEVIVRSAQDARTVEDIRGPSIAWIWGDEVGTWHNGKLAWDICIGRLRGTIKGKPDFMPRIYVTGSPKWGWLNEVFQIKGSMPPHAWTTGFFSYGTKPENACYIRATRTEDNAFNYDGYAEHLRVNYSDQFGKQELDGDFVSPSGSVFSGFYHDLHMIPHEHAMRLFHNCDLKVGGVDWGFSSPAAMVVGGVDKDDRVIIVRQWSKEGTTGIEMAHIALEWSSELGITQWYVDHDRVEFRNMWQGKIKGSVRVPGVRLALKSREAGFDVMRNRLRLESRIPHPVDPRKPSSYMYISSECKPLADDIKILRYEAKSEFDEANEKIVIPKSATHRVDALRYLVYSTARSAAMATGR